MKRKKLFRLATVPISLDILLEGQLCFLNKTYEVTAVSGESEELRRVEERERIRVVPLKMKRKIAPFKDIYSLFLLVKLFKKERPDIVHSITPKAGLLSMLAAYIVGVPIRIHTFTGLVFPSKSGFLQKILIMMDRLLCACATKVIPEGEGVKSDLIKFGITNKPLRVLAKGNINGIDTHYFNPKLFSDYEKNNLKKKLGIKEIDFVFIFVGRLVGDKGINELISAFEKLQNSILLLVGDLETDLDPLFPKTLIKIEKNKNIISLGYQYDVRPYFAISNVLVFPSYREGFPNVVMQAGAMGLASIVTDINGCNEIIIEGINGWIVPIKNELALFDAMCNCLTNTKELHKLSKNSRNLILNRFEQKLVWQALLAEYKLLEQNL